MVDCDLLEEVSDSIELTPEDAQAMQAAQDRGTTDWGKDK